MNNMILSAATAHAAQNQLPISIPDEKSMTQERISTEPVPSSIFYFTIVVDILTEKVKIKTFYH